MACWPGNHRWAAPACGLGNRAMLLPAAPGPSLLRFLLPGAGSALLFWAESQGIGSSPRLIHTVLGDLVLSSRLLPAVGMIRRKWNFFRSKCP